MWNQEPAAPPPPRPPKVVFYDFFHIFQVVWAAGLEDSFDNNMDPTGRFTTQQRIKTIEAYFATKSVLLTQRKCREILARTMHLIEGQFNV